MRFQRGYYARFERRPYSYRDSHFMPIEKRLKAAERQGLAISRTPLKRRL